jgi:DNA-nicking Smr family endonuclease
MSSPKIDINIEKNKLKRIKSGRINIEGTIDLHGFSLKEAKERLQIFVGESFRRNKRLLLIITGKGRNSKPNINGKKQTIKSEINKWLLEDFYRDKVQYISRALDKHGGEGAYYFFLVTSKNIFS